ncbi:hypothetical protein [Streptomyces chromofuscus]|uniref:Uncharacterized protein n=1 Tax=Streptomyces chromofuscus TaxID=42881 RepID=A0A7M2T8W3_STRCW|nr:hypothetical protein [Streptomyces chromofuscus]QOV45147.1 hypothetical protein IPT68_04015 [Streptomyces chromofuscus]GGT33314.1 hypothetical protein GCM10010254_62030 [Streptomyces chromofuscus]
MAQTPGSDSAVAATVEALTAKAIALEIRVGELHRALIEINSQILAVSDALHRMGGPASTTSPVDGEEPSADARDQQNASGTTA